MPPGAAVGAKVPPAANVARSSSESWRLGGALYNLGLWNLFKRFFAKPRISLAAE